MHPPFYIPDVHVGHDIHPSGSRLKPRRSAAARLEMRPAAIGWPPVPLPPEAAQPDAPSGPRPVHLVAVPAPRRSLRDWFGRWMIRQGQRMIMSHRPG